MILAALVELHWNDRTPLRYLAIYSLADSKTYLLEHPLELGTDCPIANWRLANPQTDSIVNLYWVVVTTERKLVKLWR